MKTGIKTAFKFLAWALAASLVVSVLLVALGAAMVAPFEHTTIHLDDESFTLGALHGSDWFFAVGGMLIALLIVVLVVPVTVIVPLLAVVLAVLLAAAIGLAAVAGVALLALSPVLLIGWLMWRIARPKRRAAQGPAQAPAQQPASDARLSS